MVSKRCFFCGEAGNFECEGCNGEIVACSPGHLYLHRRKSGPCFPWAVVEQPVEGRVMLTTRKVKAGETLFVEEPVVVGPNQTVPAGCAICMSCYTYLPAPIEYKCSKCRYPMCGPDCELSEVHKDECKILSRGDPPIFQESETEAYHCILPLRLLLLSRSDPEKFDLTKALMDHKEERCTGEDWLTTERTVVNHILDNCKARDIEKFTEDEIRRCLGVLEVNCYEVHSFISCGYRGCFPVASLISHGCIANSRHIWSTEPPYTNRCIATVDIEEGVEVVTSYDCPTHCSMFRRKKLMEGWYFNCQCKRCKSPDELGIEFNTIRCLECKEATLRMVDTANIQSEWSCSTCNISESYESVFGRMEQLFNKIKQISKTERYKMDTWLNILEETESLVHPNHAAIIEICKWLLPILCRAADKTSEYYPMDLWEKKLKLTTTYLEVQNRIDPGVCKSRAKAMYEKTETDIYLTLSQGISVSQIKIQKWMHACQEILFIFETLEPNNGFETVMFRNAGTIIQRLQQMVKTFEQLDKRGLLTEKSVEEFTTGWCFLQLWRWQPC